LPRYAADRGDRTYITGCYAADLPGHVNDVAGNWLGSRCRRGRQGWRLGWQCVTVVCDSNLEQQRRLERLTISYSCLINVWPQLGKRNGQRPISCQVVALSFKYVLLLNQIYFTTMCGSIIPLRFILINHFYMATKATDVGEKTQNNGHYVVQGHSRSPILVPIVRP